MRTEFPRSADPQQGVVLVLVLVILAGLTLLLSEFTRLLLLDRTSSTATRASLGAKPLLASGERFAVSILQRNAMAGDPDTPHEPWSRDYPELVREVSQGLDSAELEGEIVDENSLFPLNALLARSVKDEPRADAYAGVFMRLTARLLLEHGLAENRPDAEEKARAFTSAVRRWGGSFGVQADMEEARWYLQGDPSYLPPGSPFLSADELLLIHWQTLSPENARILLRGKGSLPGLLDLVSVWTDGPMNINTLQPRLVAALVEDADAGREFAARILAFREQENALLTKGWYQEEARQATRNTGIFPNRCVGVTSSVYRVLHTVRQGAAEARSMGVCKVDAQTVRWVVRVYW